MPIVTCPKCSYQRQPGDSHVHVGVCPSCGIAYQKFLDRRHAPPAKAAIESVPDRWPAWRARLLETPPAVPAAAFYGRAAAWCAFALWTVYFTMHGVSWEAIGNSFLHLVILPFHEFGHVLFAPFGRFLAILGGSLFQVAMPLALAVAFIMRQRDPFGASAMLWWAGQSLVDLSPYIADAALRQIDLVGGAGRESHDWSNLLTMMQLLDYAPAIARLSFGLGVLVMAAALAWGVLLLRAQYAVRAQKA
jgi:hypothetical protein